MPTSTWLANSSAKASSPASTIAPACQPTAQSAVSRKSVAATRTSSSVAAVARNWATSRSSASSFGIPWAHGVHLPQVCAALACNCPSTSPTGHWPGGMASTRRAKASTNSPVRASARPAVSTVKRPIVLSFCVDANRHTITPVIFPIGNEPIVKKHCGVEMPSGARTLTHQNNLYCYNTLVVLSQVTVGEILPRVAESVAT